MVKTYRHIIYIIILSIGLGFIMGFYMPGLFIDFKVRHKHFSITDIVMNSDTLYDYYSGKTVNFYDTLSKHKHNLLVFWSPTCSFSKNFFLNQLNEKVVGIYCFPLTDDIEYLNFYINNHRITLPQLMLKTSEAIKSVHASSIVATPTFVITDDTGNNLAKYVGINELNNMIEYLYQQN